MLLLSDPEEIAELTREIEEQAELFIKRAILERSKRKWEFVWLGLPFTHIYYWREKAAIILVEQPLTDQSPDKNAIQKVVKTLRTCLAEIYNHAI